MEAEAIKDRGCGGGAEDRAPLTFCDRINLLARNGGAQFFLGETYFEIEEFSRSKEYYEKVFLILENIRLWPPITNLAKVGLARSKVMNKEKDVDLESL